MGVLSDRRLVSRLHNWRYAVPLLKWLREVCATTFSPLSESDYASRVMAPLEQLSEEAGLVSASRDAVTEAMTAVQSGDFRPCVGPVHNDLWRGNVLLPQAASGPRSVRWPFLLIDWGASTLEGFPVWDLLRILRSLRVPNRVAARVLRQHCEELDMSLEEGRHSLMLALADLGLYRNEFPLELYLDSVETYQAYFAELAD
jgi:hypothetical protein